MTALRVFLVATLLAAAACGGGSSDEATTEVSSPQTTSTAASDTDTHSGPDTTSTSTANAAATHEDQTSTTTTVDTATIADQPPETEPREGASEPDTPSVYAPPPGRYVYDMTGTITTSDVTGTAEEPAPASSTDDVRVTDGGAGSVRMVVVTRDEGRDSTQELDIAVTEGAAHLARLSRRPDTGVGVTVTPNPPALLARLPYTENDQWEIAWNDRSTGISGVGTGTVERPENITTPAGTFDTVVVTVVQRLRGTITGTLTVTSWIDPITGVQVKQHTVTDLQDATGASRSDTTRTLRKRPA